MSRGSLPVAALFVIGLPAFTMAAEGPGLAAPLERAIAAAEASLRDGEVQAAESHYRSALLEGWLLIGTLDRIDDRLPESREAFRRASVSAVESRLALLALALVHLQMGEDAPAVQILTRLARKDPKDVQTRRLLAQALVASGQGERSVRELEEAAAAAPSDLELAFALATGYLRLKRVDNAARLFARVALARPMAQTHVLIARTYRDLGQPERARAELEMALKLDPRVRRAHYLLGKLIAAEKGRAGLEEAVTEFQAELRLAPQDPLANLELGMALLEFQRPEEALPALEIAARAEPPEASTLYYLGRSQLGVNRPAAAVVSLKRALELVERQGGATNEQLRAIHNQLGQALRQMGETQEAAGHFAEGERLSAQGTVAVRERWARQMANEPEPDRAPVVPVIEASPLAALSASERVDLARRVRAELARTYLNLGVLHARGERFARAAEQFEKAAEVDPDFPQVQASLGVAYFNARQFDKATAPLTRALAANPADAGLKRTLAMAWLNTEAYAKAAELLQDDPELATNPSLQFAYGLALVKSDQAAKAERVFSRLLAQHGESPELSVLLGKAHAQMGEYSSAIESFQRALKLKPDVAEANGALGVIFLKQGRMAEAEAALRAELTRRPEDLQSQQNLAYVLDAEQRSEEALPLLRGILRSKPDFADARYLLGRILLAQGATQEAVEHLEAATRLAPDDANAHYQLGRAYTKLGRTEEAERQFEIFRQIKAKR